MLLSDCDDRNPQVYQWLKEIPIDLGASEPFLFASASGAAMPASGLSNRKKAVIYHVPAESIDKMKVAAWLAETCQVRRGLPGAVMADGTGRFFRWN